MLHGRAAAAVGILLLPSEQNMVICAWHCWDDPVIAAPDTLEAGGEASGSAPFMPLARGVHHHASVAHPSRSYEVLQAQLTVFKSQGSFTGSVLAPGGIQA